jgi:hypothetical protein
MKENKTKNFDWFMLLFVIPFALFGATVLWVGQKDIEEHKIEKEMQARADSLLMDSVHLYEDGM